MTRIDGPRRRGHGTVLADDLPTPPVNVGLRSTPNYDGARRGAPSASCPTARRSSPASATIRSSSISTCSTCSPCRRPTSTTSTALAGFNVHSHRDRGADRDADGERRAAELGDRSECRHRRVVHGEPAVGHESRRRPGDATATHYVQVSRLGQPLVNEVVIPRGVKDTFNALEPTSDAAALDVRHRSGSAEAAARRSSAFSRRRRRATISSRSS